MDAVKRLGLFGYAIYVDGRDVGMSFATADAALESAVNLMRMNCSSIVVVERGSATTVDTVKYPRRII